MVIAGDGIVCWLNLATRAVSCMQTLGSRAGSGGWPGSLNTTDLPDAYRTVWASDAVLPTALAPRAYLSLTGSDYTLCALRQADKLPECYITPSIAATSSIPEHVGRAPSAWPLIPSFPVVVLAAAGPAMDDVVCLHLLTADETLNRSIALAANASRTASVVTRCFGRQGAVQLVLNGAVSMPVAAANVATVGSWSLVAGYNDVCQTLPPPFVSSASSATCWGGSTAAGISAPASVPNRHAAAGDGFLCVTSTATASFGQVFCYNGGAAGTAAVGSAVTSFLAPNMSYPVLTLVNRTNTTWYLWTNVTNVTTWANVTVEVLTNTTNASLWNLTNTSDSSDATGATNVTTLMRFMNTTYTVINQTVVQVIKVPINVTHFARPQMGALCASRAFVCGLAAPTNATLMYGHATLSCAGTGPEIANMAVAVPPDLANGSIRVTLPVSNTSGASYFTVEAQFTDLSCGGSFVCARRRSDSGLFCLGDSSAAASGALEWSDVGPVTQYCTGRAHVCVLDSAGFATCRGEPGPGVAFATQWANNAFTHIACARDSTCGVNSSGYVLCSSSNPALAMADGVADTREAITPQGVFVEPAAVAARAFVVDQVLAADDSACRRGDAPGSGGALLCRTLAAALQAASLAATITIRGRVNVTGPLLIPSSAAGLTLTGVVHPTTGDTPALVFWPPLSPLPGVRYDLLTVGADLVTVQTLSIGGGPALAEPSAVDALYCASAVFIGRRFVRLSNVSFFNLACSAEIVRASVPANLRPAWASSVETLPDITFVGLDFGGFSRRASAYPAAIDFAAGSADVFSCAGFVATDAFLSVFVDGIAGVLAWPTSVLASLPCTNASISPAVGLVGILIDSRYRSYGYAAVQRAELLSTVPANSSTGALLGTAAIRLLGLSRVNLDDVTLSGFLQPADGNFAGSLGTVARKESTCVPAASGFEAACSAGIGISFARRVAVTRLRASNMRTLARLVGSGAVVAVQGLPRNWRNDDSPYIYFHNCAFADTSAAESGGTVWVAFLDGASDRSTSNPRATLVVTNTSFQRSAAIYGSGGAVAVVRAASQSDGFTLVLSAVATPVIFTDCSAGQHGGGIFVGGFGVCEYYTLVMPCSVLPRGSDIGMRLPVAPRRPDLTLWPEG